MAGRPGVVANATREADGGTSPNAYRPFVSAHVRVNWPPRATLAEVLGTIDDAYREAIRLVEERRGGEAVS